MASTFSLQFADETVDRVGLVQEREPFDAARRHDARRALERHADVGHLGPLVRLDGVGREDRLAGLVDDVRREELEVGAGEAVAVEAAVRRMAAALLHAEQFGCTLIELVVADRVEVEADEVHRLDRRFVVEQRRQQRTGTDQVTCRHHRRVALLIERPDVARQVLRAARRDGVGVRRRVGARVPRRRVDDEAKRLEGAVEVVDGDDLDIDGSRTATRRRTGAGCGSYQRHRHGSRDAHSRHASADVHGCPPGLGARAPYGAADDDELNRRRRNDSRPRTVAATRTTRETRPRFAGRLLPPGAWWTAEFGRRASKPLRSARRRGSRVGSIRSVGRTSEEGHGL